MACCVIRIPHNDPAIHNNQTRRKKSFGGGRGSRVCIFHHPNDIGGEGMLLSLSSSFSLCEFVKKRFVERSEEKVVSIGGCVWLRYCPDRDSGITCMALL